MMITKERDEELKAMAEMRMKASEPHPYMRELALKRIAGTISPLQQEALDRFYETPGMSGGFTPFILNNEQEAERIRYHEERLVNEAFVKELRERKAGTYQKKKPLTDEEFFKLHGMTREEAIEEEKEREEAEVCFLEGNLIDAAEHIISQKIYAEKGKGVLDNPDKYPALCGLQNKDRQLIEAETRASMGEKYIEATLKKIDDRLLAISSQPQTETPARLEIGWKKNRLSLISRPENRKPAVFQLGSKRYFVPSGKAWDWVENVILQNGFEGHPVETNSPSPHFKREARDFFKDLIKPVENKLWYIKTN